MSARLQIRVKTKSKSTPSLVQMRSGCLQRRSANHAEPTTVPPIVHEVLRSPGQPLDSVVRNVIQPHFGHDLSQVRVHTDAKAAESAWAVNALAYAAGCDVVFGDGQYAPQTNEGRRLIMHELAHVVQQGGSGSLRLGEPDAPEERAADMAAQVMMEKACGRMPPLGRDNAPTLRRVSFGSDGELSAGRQATVRSAAAVAQRLVEGGGGLPNFRRVWDAFWERSSGSISPQPTLEAYQEAVRGRIVHDMDTSTNPDVQQIVSEERSMPLERQTAGVTPVGSSNTYLREFAIDQGGDTVVSLLLHESMHGAGVSMGPALIYEPFLHQFEAEAGFPMMMGGAAIGEISQVRQGDYHVDVIVPYSLHRIDVAPLPTQIEIQIVSPETGEVVYQEEADTERHPVRARIPSRVGSRSWTWHARYPGFARYSVRLVDMATNTLMASRQIETNPRCVLGVSSVHCEGD